jgi:hypothetical protein
MKFVFDRSNPSIWKESAKDDQLLQKINYQHCEFKQLPIIIYDGVVSPMIHGQMFGVLQFMNHYDSYEQNIQGGKEDLIKTV